MCDEPDAGRECVIKGLCVYMGEDPENLVQEYVDMDENAIKEVIQDTTIGIYVIKRSTFAEPEDIGIILEGISVLQDLENVVLAVALLFGLMYALNLNYPVDLRYTFEVVQKVFMGLDGSKPSNKTFALKNQLLTHFGLLFSHDYTGSW